MINLEQELEGFYGTECYHRIDKQYACTDGIACLLNKFDHKFTTKLYEVIKNLCSFDHLMMFCKIVIKDGNVSLITYKDITEDGKGYIEPYYYNNFYTVEGFKDCEIKTMVYNYVWLLMSEY